MSNALSWRGIWVLTAPNMAGKSSLMRATTVACLLANAGLFAPCDGVVPRYDACRLTPTLFIDPALAVTNGLSPRPGASPNPVP